MSRIKSLSVLLAQVPLAVVTRPSHSSARAQGMMSVNGDVTSMIQRTRASTGCRRRRYWLIPLEELDCRTRI
jgi:hypothetical protein